VFSRRNSRALADAQSQVIWGVIIFTIGCYIWRGARKRGWIDRSGRILISIGYLVIGFGMSKATLVLGLALTLIAVVGWFLVADESICLDRRPWWGPPESGVNTDCSGHIDELLRKWGWVS
jgi:hypothetical protein